MTLGELHALQGPQFPHLANEVHGLNDFPDPRDRDHEHGNYDTFDNIYHLKLPTGLTFHTD